MNLKSNNKFPMIKIRVWTLLFYSKMPLGISYFLSLSVKENYNLMSSLYKYLKIVLIRGEKKTFFSRWPCLSSIIILSRIEF